MKALILVGTSASGKSTFTKTLDDSWIISERDIHREHILVNIKQLCKSTDNIFQFWKFKWEDEVNVYEQNDIKLSLDFNKNICFANTNLNKDRRDALKLKLEALGYEVEIKVFGLDLTFEELCKRDLWRKNSVGRDIIWKQWKQFNAEFGIKPIKFDATLPKRFLIDLDGTLALHNSGRNAFEWHRVKEDTVNEVVMAMMYGVTDNYRDNPMPIFMSGRDSICRKDTIDWLHGNTKYNREWIAENLYMRAEGDMRPDTIVKEELIKNNLVDKYNIILALDDRLKVIRHYNLLGIYVINCSYILEEF